MEVLTLQFGHFANHVGAHFWNFEDECAALQDATPEEQRDENDFDFERLHSQTEHRGVLSWNPRLVLVDKKGALGSWCSNPAEQAELQEEAAHSVLWDYGKETHEADRVEVHDFQQDLAADDYEQWAQAGDSSQWQGDEDRNDDYGEGMDVDAAGPSDGIDRPSVMKPTKDYDFRSTVRTWTDFLKIKLPGSSVHELQACHHDVQPFSLFFDGLAIRGRADEEKAVDLARKQLELCDQLDSLHTIVDMHDGFGGVADVVLRWAQEEQPKSGRLVFAVMPELPPPPEPPCEGEDDANGGGVFGAAAPAAVGGPDVEGCAWLSAAFSLTRLLDTGVDAWAPLAVPLWSAQGPPALPGLRREVPYEASALIGVALQNVTLPYRLKGSQRPSSFLSALMPSHRPVSGILQAFPLPESPAQPSPEHGGNGGHCRQTLDSLSSHFFDLCAMPVGLMNQHTSLVLRGASPRRLVSLCSALPPPALRLSFCREAVLPMPLPFPQVFGPAVSRKGILAEASYPSVAPRDESQEVVSAPVATRLHAASGAGRSVALGRMAVAARSAWKSGVSRLLESKYGVEGDEFREVVEAITEQLECSAADGDDGDDGDDGYDSG
mmetsp:Transcript_25273/g.72006  ORF Transcript_25273/g.72006 Transcript_25273/m.72006 type:complete len:607 (-) Transcript_25273:113-1933(-)|eukprot:CAMPEP_0177186622 /NCGR_PEP_ID=MMETSP0367-20130122/18753_1 /TAXON_ID=447022 ORGANISM="Scrippsiella hangoei-like, Strain SHHI-4" /NCGR_SAMPLE_ID=MMETSP0367 /ASSEMBLY_ACC=CAM_ASM_000362 /LENGTH=606 /DNA_ID=CAMNT_0018633945 /DNA_START=124 /DNA_END=1944 /DNA_ORIENTATION=+